MSNIERFENLKQIVKAVEPDFNALATIHGAVNYKKEASFAIQALQDNSLLRSNAFGDPDSLKRAIINVAAIGLSLDPIRKLAYLVPRDKKVHLDISYRGYIQLAVDVGAVKWVAAEVVYEKDEYTYCGMGREPIHKFNPFSKDRGEIVGAYCVAKTHDGEFILTQMSSDEILSIRNRSASYKAGKNSPWETDTTEMIKKTVIKRAAKSWPMIDTRVSRFEKAIDVTNEADPVDFSAAVIAPPEEENIRAQKLEEIRAALKFLDRSEDKFVEHMVRVTNRPIKTMNDMTDQEVMQAISMLNQFVETKKKKQQEVVNENAG